MQLNIFLLIILIQFKLNFIIFLFDLFIQKLLLTLIIFEWIIISLELFIDIYLIGWRMENPTKDQNNNRNLIFLRILKEVK